MKRSFISLLFVITLFTAFQASSQEVTFTDYHFESYIKDLLNKTSTEKVYASDMETITSIYIQYYDIKNIEGIQYATNLESATFDQSVVDDFSPLKNLKKISNFKITVHAGGSIDLSGLKGFNPEVDISMTFNYNDAQMSDASINPLRGVQNLVSLDLFRSGPFTKDSIRAIIDSTKLTWENVTYTQRGLSQVIQDVTYYASYVEEIESNYYNLKGDLKIQGDLGTSFSFYGGEMILDFRTTDKKVYFNGEVYRLTGTLPVISGDFSFKHSHYYDPNTVQYYTKLIPEEPIEPASRYGTYGFKISALDISNGYVNIRLNPEELPFPLNHNIFEGNYSPGSYIYASEQNYFDSKPPYNFGNFAITDLSTSYRYDATDGETLSGNMTVRVPGFKYVGGDYGYGPELLEVGTEISFSNGEIDKLIVSSTASIPLGGTGLSITRIEGGINNFSKSDWQLKAYVDIETGIDLPVVGSPIAITNFGVTVQPFSKFEGSGNFELFKSKVANGKISYDHDIKKLNVFGGVDLGGILTGQLTGNLSASGLQGEINGNLHTPKELPWGFGWAADKDLASCVAFLKDNLIWTDTKIWRFRVVQTLTFGNPDFPYFDYSIGRNFQSITGKTKSTKSSAFNVSENVPLLLVVAGNETDLIDFKLIAPSGTQYDSTNTDFEIFEDVKQSVMGIASPESGSWTFNADGFSNVSFEAMEQYSLPVASFIEPVLPNSPENKIYVRYLPTENSQIKLYVDNDRQNFDGVEIESGSRIPNDNFPYVSDDEEIVSTTFSSSMFYNDDRRFESGEYFVYYELIDSQNAPIRKYAPGSFSVNRGEIHDYKPESFSYDIIDDTLHLYWEQPADTSFQTKIYIKDLKRKTTSEYFTEEGTDSLVIDSLDYNNMYYAYAKFFTLGVDEETDDNYSQEFLYSESSDTLTITLQEETVNTAPFFLTSNFSEWILTESKYSEFLIEATDIDGDELTISLDSNIEGITYDQNYASWTPADSMIGFHDLIFVVSDGTLTDTLNIIAEVKEAELSEITLSAGKNESNPDYYFFEVTNNQITDEKISITVTNTDDNAYLDIDCYLTNDATYEANVLVTEIESLGVQTDSLKVTYYYENEEISTWLVIGNTTNIETFASNKILFDVYPNPVKDYLIIQSGQSNLNNALVSIYNQNGRLIYQKETEGNFDRIDSRNWAKGIYLIKINSNQKAISKKIIKL